MHFDANIIQHVYNFLVVMFSISLLPLEHISNEIKSFCVVLNLIKILQLLQSILNLCLNLFPLQLIILENRLDLLDQLLLINSKLFFLNSERVFDVLEESIRCNYLIVSLLFAVYNYLFYVRVLKFKFFLNFGDYIIDCINRMI